MKKVVHWFAILLCMFNYSLGYTQSTCRLKKIMVYDKQLETQNPKENTLPSQSYEIFYDNGKISYIQHQTQDAQGKLASLVTWNFIQQKDIMYVIAGKDTLFRFRYDKQGRIKTARPKYGFLEYVYAYDAQGRIDSVRAKPYMMDNYEDLYQKFNYESTKEATFKFKDGLSQNYKGTTVFDDKTNPFYKNLELYIIINSPIVYHFTAHNTLKTYLLTSIGSIIIYKHQYQYNTQGYPISDAYFHDSSDFNKTYFQNQKVYEYDCQ